MKRIKVSILDYGLGNILSVKRGLEFCGVDVLVTKNEKEILKSHRVVLPGVGAFKVAMDKLKKLGLDNTLRELAEKETPLLGICLGMQILMSKSKEFGSHDGLNLISGTVDPISEDLKKNDNLKIPHVSWNKLIPNKLSNFRENYFMKGIKENDYFYFVHSFVANTSSKEDTLAYCDYGGYALTAIIKRDQIMGCQFHPEKSGKAGLRLLKSFCD
ncbi:imidazole glycerol phosphate synthase subunit HisH, partial [Gammaproteobacteria bacterium]|nr:imidazole glycerol phosphate synthase subunit HisH [Gammaproteobacteria bacterium]